ncbi:MAG TPA: hypothetical protein DEO57_03495 [Phycisphaerales bacterium]|nr:hypothetical protein [Phycisphaerales bacterium]
MHRLRPHLLLIPFLLTLQGCLAGGGPVVDVESIELTGVNDTAMALVLNGSIANPHERECRLLQFEYVLTVDGRQVYRGRHAAEMTLSPGAKRAITLPASFPYSTVGWIPSELPDESSWAVSGSLVYLGSGVLSQTLLDLGYRPSVGYSASGALVLAPSN